LTSHQKFEGLVWAKINWDVLDLQVRMWRVGILNILLGTEFVNNSARLDDSNSFGAIMLIESHLNATGLSMRGNSGTWGGAAFVQTSGHNATLKDCSFDGNIAGNSAGAIYLEGLKR
jgi:hypothetical protein